MAAQPQEFISLSKNERQAYRTLLYYAMLDVRHLCQPRGSESRNPIQWRRQYRFGRIAGAIADWLHNFAQIAATDFSRFDTDRFWQEYHHLCQRFAADIGPGKWIDYEKRYEDRLAELNARRHR